MILERSWPPDARSDLQLRVFTRRTLKCAAFRIQLLLAQSCNCHHLEISKEGGQALEVAVLESAKSLHIHMDDTLHNHSIHPIQKRQKRSSCCCPDAACGQHHTLVQAWNIKTDCNTVSFADAGGSAPGIKSSFALRACTAT